MKNVHCHTDRASWDAILVTVVAFGALMWKTCAQSHRFGLGRVGGGGDTIGGGGSANREPGSYIRFGGFLTIKESRIYRPNPILIIKAPTLRLPEQIASHRGKTERCASGLREVY